MVQTPPPTHPRATLGVHEKHPNMKRKVVKVGSMKPIDRPSMDPRGVDWLRELRLLFSLKPPKHPLLTKNDDLQYGSITQPTVRRWVAIVTVMSSQFSKLVRGHSFI